MPSTVSICIAISFATFSSVDVSVFSKSARTSLRFSAFSSAPPLSCSSLFARRGSSRSATANFPRFLGRRSPILYCTHNCGHGRFAQQKSPGRYAKASSYLCILFFKRAFDYFPVLVEVIGGCRLEIWLRFLVFGCVPNSIFVNIYPFCTGHKSLASPSQIIPHFFNARSSCIFISSFAFDDCLA